MAEHVSRQRFGYAIDPASAGFHPQQEEDTKHALDALRQFGIDVPGHQPRAVRYADPTSFDLIVTMDSDVAAMFWEEFPALNTTMIEEWNVTDPWDNPACYGACVEIIFSKVSDLVKRLCIGE
jgi:protein-tyrosine-phosphatase